MLDPLPLQSPMSGIFLALPDFPFPLLFNFFILLQEVIGLRVKRQKCIRKHHSDYILLMQYQQHPPKMDSLNWLYDEAVYYCTLS